MPTTHLAGWGGRISVRDFVLDATRWSVTERVEELDVTTGRDSWVVNSDNPTFGLYRGLTGGIREAEVQAEALWVAEEDPFGDPPYLVAGSMVKRVSLLGSRAEGVPEWFFWRMLVCSVS